jgi:putative ABC transport system ATP-binding protein
MGLSREIYRVGLEYQPGLGGRGLFTTQRAAVDIARSLIKRPPVLVLDDALASFSDEDAARLLQRIREACHGRGLIATVRDPVAAHGFDQILHFAEGRIAGNEVEEAVEPPAAQVA